MNNFLKIVYVMLIFNLCGRNAFFDVEKTKKGSTTSMSTYEYDYRGILVDLVLVGNDRVALEL